ncbi:hypothetical protein SDC9_126705 [bioreactor metagenome]|uniref:Uncharacterized protein n=1 Tax=bioreactor metagenome TaxID=1076179 RepID=A0A645CRF8_9ZZZZ
MFSATAFLLALHVHVPLIAEFDRGIFALGGAGENLVDPLRNPRRGIFRAYPGMVEREDSVVCGDAVVAVAENPHTHAFHQGVHIRLRRNHEVGGKGKPAFVAVLEFMRRKNRKVRPAENLLRTRNGEPGLDEINRPLRRRKPERLERGFKWFEGERPLLIQYGFPVEITPGDGKHGVFQGAAVRIRHFDFQLRRTGFPEIERPVRGQAKTGGAAVKQRGGPFPRQFGRRDLNLHGTAEFPVRLLPETEVFAP